MRPKFFTSGRGFRSWLETNHNKKPELQVGFYKLSSGKPSITYEEAVDEALCFGWIDGVRHSLGNDSYTTRFTPRRAGSNWSAKNIKRVGELKKAGLMTPPGLAAFKQLDPAKAQVYSYENRNSGLDDEMVRTFRKEKEAWAFFQTQPPGYRRVAGFWVVSAKQDATKERRLAQLIAESADGKRLGMLTSPGKTRERRS